MKFLNPSLTRSAAGEEALQLNTAIGHGWGDHPVRRALPVLYFYEARSFQVVARSFSTFCLLFLNMHLSLKSDHWHAKTGDM